MPHDVCKTVFYFSELTDKAKDRARDWYRESIGQDFSDFGAEAVLEDAVRMGALFGLDIRTRPVKLMNGSTRPEPDVYWSVDCRDQGASFAGSYAYQKGGAAKVATEAPAGKTNDSNTELNQIVATLQEVQKRNGYQLRACIRHARDLRLEIEVEKDNGRDVSEADAETVSECLRDFAQWIHASLELEWAYQNSDPAVDESIKANEYEFTEDGRRYA